MVVTRRAPAPPAPATPRSDSSHTLYKLKSKAPEPTPAPDTNMPRNTTTPDSPKKGGKGKQKGKQKKGGKKAKRSNTFTDLLAGFLFVWFTMYSLTVCPNDGDLERPICKGLYAYRRLILEPYIFPPFQAALAHPSIAPHIARAKPHVENVIAISKPVVIRTQYEWNKRVLPQWRKRVVPQWRKHVVPEIERLEKAAQPYRLRVEQEYTRRLAPHIRTATYNLQRWQNIAQPYVILAANKTHEGYVLAKPYAIPAWEQFKAFVRHILSILAVQRRQYVDPHVARLWEQIKESSSGKSGTASNKAVAKSSTVLPDVVASTSSWSEAAKSSGSVVSSAFKAPSVISANAAKAASSASAIATDASSVASSAAAPLSSSVSSSSSSVSSEVSSVISAQGSSASSTASQAISGVSTDLQSSASSASSYASSIIAESASSVTTLASAVSSGVSSAASSLVSVASVTTSSVVQELDSTISAASSAASSSASAVVDTVYDGASGASSIVSSLASKGSDTASSVAAGVGSSIVSTGSTVSSVASSLASEASSSASSLESALTTESIEDDNSELDPDSFLADLGISEDISSLEAETEDLEGTSSVVYEESEEEEAERLQREEEAREEKKRETAAKRANVNKRHTSWEQQLDAQIKTKTKDLRRGLVAVRKAAVTELKESAVIQVAVEELVLEGDKYLKGAEGYFKNLKKEKRNDDEKATLWDRVVEKVDGKFTQKLRETEDLVNTWYSGVEQQELQEVFRAAQEVKDVAERAQADIGLDYVWLDDVTYSDWQRYHDLVRRSENFTDLAFSLQNGTHTSPPANVVLTALADLESEVDDVVKGFETRLRRIKRTGDRSFRAGQVVDGDEEDPVSEPQVSILPAEPNDPAKLADSPPPIAIGRGAQEVQEALARAGAEAGVGVTESVPPHVDEEKDDVERIVEEAEAEAAAADPIHVEL